MTTLPKYLIYSCLVTLLAFIACHDKSSKDKFADADTTKIQSGVDIQRAADSLRARTVLPARFSYVDEFKAGLYKIQITTYYINDTLSDQEAWEAIRWPIVERQKMEFRYKDSVFAAFDFPTKKISRETSRGKKVQAAEMVIWNANLIEGNNNTVLFGILEASGLCNGSYCPTYDGIFKLNGSPVYQIYADDTKQQTLLIASEPHKWKLSTAKLKEKVDSIELLNGLSNEILNKSWVERRKIGINK